METYSFFGIILYTLFVSQIFGYPYNDISIDCDSMLPDHGNAPQTSSPPYVISVSFDRYDPGNEIQVILEGTSTSGFTAFMVQAREIDGNVPVGIFHIVDRNTRGLHCDNMTNSAVSHSNPMRKHRVITTWVAPQGTRRIRIMGTFVQDYENYWVGVHSKTLSPRDVPTNALMSTNRSMLTNDSIGFMVSEIPDDLDTSSDSDEDIDFNVLSSESDEKYVSNTTVGSQNRDRRSTTRKSRRKGKVSQSNTGACVKSLQESSQSSDSQSKDGGANVYNKYSCRDSEAESGEQPSYGQMKI
ncbi:putative ferric-chelate reductase 1 [Erythrolamprus reginae]|uniref:putative ferric-chelate reductase 1 n=1 Tax=Erythrolamprus reginae TaxID=121349 RepID=UPI00396C71D9